MGREVGICINPRKQEAVLVSVEIMRIIFDIINDINEVSMILKTVMPQEFSISLTACLLNADFMFC